MICQRCLYRLRISYPSSSLISPPSIASNVAVSLLSPGRQPVRLHGGLPAIVWRHSGLQPFSTSSSLHRPADASTTAEVPASKSSVPAGTPLKGLGYFKNKDPPLAMEDSEYPAWLWGLLDESKEGSRPENAEGEGDLYSKSKKQRRLASRAAARAAKTAPKSVEPKIPLEHQSIDLPAGDGSVAGALQAVSARDEVRDAMRKGRRKGIKEGNFLKTMR